MILYIFFIIFTYQSAYAANNDIDLNCKSAIVIDYLTNEVLYEKNADDKQAPSSMTKIMTLLIAFDAIKNGSINKEDKVKISTNASKIIGSKSFLSENDIIDLWGLILSIIIHSGNDACIAIAEHIYGSEQSFVNQMNKTAKAIEMNDTNFENVHGLNRDNHYSTVRDIAKMCKILITEYPDFYKEFSHKELTINDIKQYNRNALLGTIKGVDGIKTGYTDAGGYGIAISAIRGKRRVIVVLNGSESEQLRKQDGSTLVNYAFNNFVVYKIFDKDKEFEKKIPVWMGEKEHVGVYAKEEISVCIPKDKIKNTIVKIKYKGPIPAVIKKDDIIATLIIIIDNVIKKEYKLYATETIQECSFFNKAKNIIKDAIYKNNIIQSLLGKNNKPTIIE